MKSTAHRLASRFAALGATLTLCAWSSAFAGPVYKWQDENGVVHYSSTPQGKNAKPAALPPIMRGELKLAQPRLVTCDKHGGVDCRAGADADGSVICSDGFKGSSARFRFSCSAPKLDVADVSAVAPDGGFSVFVRNSRSVAAKAPSVSVRNGEGKTVTLEGPAEVEPYGIAEFQLKGDPLVGGVLFPLSEKPDPGQITIACANCP